MSPAALALSIAAVVCWVGYLVEIHIDHDDILALPFGLIWPFCFGGAIGCQVDFVQRNYPAERKKAAPSAELRDNDGG